ncbi:MAG: choice-of-anchor tandem repeat GloVer-containing protein, partial [Terriglobales bacterium]
MNNLIQHRSWILGMRGRVAGAALALAIMLLPAVLATRSAQAQTYSYKVLYSFTGSPDAAFPGFYGTGVTLDVKGNLYGTTGGGGTYGQGTVFKVDTKGKETVLYSFAGTPDGSGPNDGLVRDAQGNLYGTTQAGGSGSGIWGTVFKLDTAGHETVLHSFNSADGGYPIAGLAQDAQGNLFGTTFAGGAYSGGTVYEVDTTGKETVLYNFCVQGCPPDGTGLYGGVVLDAQGNLYGTTASGGAYGQGTVFKVDTTGKETVLYSFCVQGYPCTDGAGPEAALVRDAQGNLYGTSVGGGALGYGTVFKLDTSDNLTVLYSFAGTPDGFSPVANVVRDAQGNLYGTTFDGGNSGCGAWNSCGTVFKLDTTGNETVLHRFTGLGGDGANPAAGLALDAKGNLYGTTSYGGNIACQYYGYCFGTVFKLTPAKVTKTTTTLTSAPNPSTYGEAVTFAAMVAPAPPDGEI